MCVKNIQILGCKLIQNKKLPKTNAFMKYRFPFNFPTVNEQAHNVFYIHCETCTCRFEENGPNSFWTNWYSHYDDAHDHLYRLLSKFRDHDFEIRPCGQCC